MARALVGFIAVLAFAFAALAATEDHAIVIENKGSYRISQDGEPLLIRGNVSITNIGGRSVTIRGFSSTTADTVRATTMLSFLGFKLQREPSLWHISPGETLRLTEEEGVDLIFSDFEEGYQGYGVVMFEVDLGPLGTESTVLRFDRQKPLVSISDN